MDVLAADGGDVQRDLVCIGVHRSAVCPELLVSRGSGQGHVEDLILDVLAGVGVVQRNEVVEEREVETDLVRLRVLRPEVRVIDPIRRCVSHHRADRVLQRGAVVETAAVAWYRIIRSVIRARLSDFSVGGAQLTVGQEVVLQCVELGKDEAERNGRIGERTVVARHARDDVVTDRSAQVEHVAISPRGTGEVADRTGAMEGAG